MLRSCLVALAALAVGAAPAHAITAIIAAVAGAGIGSALASAFAQIAISVLASFVLGAVSRALQKEPTQAPLSFDLASRIITVRQAIAAWRVIYGRVRTGGVYTFIHTTGGSNQFLHMVITLTGQCRVKSIGNLFLDGEEVPIDESGNATGRFAGYVKMFKRLGDPDQTAIQELIDAAPDKWTEAHRQRGCAHVYLRFEYNQNLFPNGVPNPTLGVEGKDDIWDPRSEEYGYTNNAPLCQADYLANTVWGLRAPYGTRIDEDDLIESANIADEDIVIDESTSPDTTEKRYTCNGVFEVSEKPFDILGRLLTASAGTLVLAGGRWRVRAGAYRTPEITLDEDDIVGPVEVQTMVPARESFNGVKGTFVSPEKDWQEDDFPAYKRDVYVDEDGGVPKWKDTKLPFTTSPFTAQRVAKIDLERARRPHTFTAPFKLKAYQAIPSDTVRLPLARYGWDSGGGKEFEVKRSQLALRNVDGAPALVVNMTLRAIDAQAYEWAASEAADWPAAPATSLPDAFDAPAVTGLTVSSTGLAVVAPDGTVIPRLLVSWTAPASVFLTQYEVQWRRSDGAGTNLIIRSAALDHAAWLSVGSPVVSSAGGSAWEVEDDSGSVEEGKYQAVIFAGDSVVFSVKVAKAASDPGVYPRIVTSIYAAGSSPLAIVQHNLSINPATGELGIDGAVPGGGAGVVDFDDDYWRLWAIVPNTVAADRAQLFLFPAAYDAFSSGSPYGTPGSYSTALTGALVFDEPDIKVGDRLTSHVPTTSAPAAGPETDFDQSIIFGRERDRVFLTAGIEAGQDYDVRVRARYNNGAISDWTTVGNHEAGGKASSSAAPTGLALTAVAEGLLATWDVPADRDVRETEVYLSALNDRSTATKVAAIAADAFLIANVPAGATRYVWVRAIDRSGNASDWSNGATAGASGTAVNPAEADSIVGQGEFATVDQIDDTNVDFLVGSAVIKSAHIQSLAAGKITTGTLDVDTLIEIRDQAGSPGTVRVQLGKLGLDPEDYGIKVFDSNGELVVGSDGLGLEVVGSAQIQDLAVETIKIADASVVRKSSASSTTNVSPSSVGSWQQLLSVTHDSEGEEALLFINVAFAHNFNTTVDSKVDIRVRRTSPSGVTYEQINAITVPYLAAETSGTLVAFYRFSGTIGALSSGNNTIVVEAALSASSGTGRATAKDRSIMVLEPLK